MHKKQLSIGSSQLPVESLWIGRLETFFRQYGLLALLALLCYGCYYRVHLETAKDLRMLQQMHENLLSEKELAYRTKAELTLHWQSVEDPAWRQLILMRELGLVPKGFKKVVFTYPTREGN